MTDTTPGGWPDKPGVPLNPERDGWHWLGDDRHPQPVLWLAEFASWSDGTMHSPQSVVGLGFRYIGPCLLPSEVAVREEAARRDERREARDAHFTQMERLAAQADELGGKGKRDAIVLRHAIAVVRARGDA